MALRRCAVRHAKRATEHQPPEGWVQDRNPYTPYHAQYYEKMYPNANLEKSWYDGPVVETQPSVAGTYSGNCKTPTWLYGEGEVGAEILAKCNDLFKPYEPTRKKAVGNFRLRLAPGAATAGPPVGTTFASQGVKGMDFVKEFNERTRGVFRADPTLTLKVYMRFYEDKTYQYRIMPPTTGWLLSGAARLQRKGKFGAGSGVGNEGRWEGYLTLQQLYHVAAIQQSWGQFPDLYPIEARILDLTKAAKLQGICVMGVHCRAPPKLGMSDDEQLAWFEEQRVVYEEKRNEVAKHNPLDRTPWLLSHQSTGHGDYEINTDATVDKKQLIKDAQAIDKNFQAMMKDPKTTRDPVVLWEHWKKTGVLLRDKTGPTAIEQRQIAEAQQANLGYLLRAHPNSIAKTKATAGTQWYTDEWSEHHTNMMGGSSSRIR